MSEEEPKVPPVPQPDGLTDEDIAKAKTSVLISTAALLVAGNSLVHGRDLKRVVRVDCLGRVNAEIDRRLPWPPLVVPKGDVDDELATAAALLEVSARSFAFFKDGDVDIGTVREALKKAAVAYTKAEQRFGREIVRVLSGPSKLPAERLMTSRFALCVHDILLSGCPKCKAVEPALCGAEDSTPFEYVTLGQTCQNPRPCAKHGT